MTRAAVIALTLAVAIPRVMGVTSEPYQAVAHLWVGGLAGAWLAVRERLWLILAGALTAVEVVAFLVDRLS